MLSVEAYRRAMAWAQEQRKGAAVFDARVAVVEAQPTLGVASAVSVDANALYDLGVAVVATAGNNDPSADQPLAAPANAKKVMGIGAYDIIDKNVICAQRGGGDPSISNFVYKPDFQAPADVEGAANDTMGLDLLTTACVHPFGGTSGAAPWAGVLAMAYYQYAMNVLHLGNTFSVGEVYAMLLARGNLPNVYHDTIYGVGQVQLGSPACDVWTVMPEVVHFNAGDVTVAVPISDVTTHDSDFSVAVWWPEGNDEHNQIDLEIRDAKGALVATSSHPNSVWQMEIVPNSAVTTQNEGTWRAELIPDVSTAATAHDQLAYVAAHRNRHGTVGCP